MSNTIYRQSNQNDSFEERMNKVSKVAGKRPELPGDLPTGSGSEQALRVLNERYLNKDDSGKVIETADEMVWRVAFAVAGAESLWDEDRQSVFEQAKRFYR